MTKRTIYATVTFPSGKDIRLSFVEGDGKVFIYSKTAAYGGFNVSRFGNGEKLDRAWVRDFAAESNAEVIF